MKKSATRVFFLALLMVLPAVAGPGVLDLRAQGGKSKKDKEKKEPAPTQVTTIAVKPAVEDPNYVIGEEDSLSISVWKEPDLSRSVPVRPDGKISLPLLNDVQASGLTPMQLADLITEKLRKFVADPQVTVIVNSIQSRRFFVLGEVGRVGSYPLLHGMTLLQALSGAGGFTQFANPKKIYLMRTENGKQVRYLFNYKDALKGKNPEQNIEIKPGDTIVVP
jgi:polysaccharide export outer membrane protein